MAEEARMPPIQQALWPISPEVAQQTPWPNILPEVPEHTTLPNIFLENPNPQHLKAGRVGLAAFAMILATGILLIALGKTQGFVIAGAVTMGGSLLPIYVTEVYVSRLKMLARDPGQHLTLRDWAFCLLLKSSRKKTS